MEFALTVVLASASAADNSYESNRRRTSTVSAYLWISIGAIAGASARYSLSRFIAKVVTVSFPYGTLLINITGSFILGLFLVWSTERALVDPRWRLLVAIGFCGSYTTFSSYAFESFSLFEQGHYILFASNVLANNVLCITGVLAGAIIARSL
jgi:fluoride exporter